MTDTPFFAKNGIVANLAFTANSTVITIPPTAKFIANGTSGSSGFLLYSNNAGVYWAAPPIGVDPSAQYAWTNTQSFSNTITFNSVLNSNTFNANVANVNTINATSYSVGGTLTANSSGLWTNFINVSTSSGTGLASYSTSGIGITGSSNTAYGVIGLSNTYAGVVGQSTTAQGGWFNSTSGQGVVGISNSSQGVYGISNTAVGGYFVSNTGYGTWSQSNFGNIAAFANNSAVVSYIDHVGNFTGTANNSSYFGGHLPNYYVANNTSPTLPSISFSANAAIYSDTTGGNSPDDIVIRTHNTSNYYYTIFQNDGTIRTASNFILGGSVVYDSTSQLRLQFQGGGNSSYYRSYGSGWGHIFMDASGTTRWLMGGSSSDINFYSQGDIIAAWSDERLKENITSFETSEGLKNVLSYRVVDFSWNEKGRAINSKPEGLRERGLIAQEAQKVNSQIVANNETALDENGKPYLTVKENKIVFDLIAAIQEQQKQIEDLKKRISLLEGNK